MQAINRRDAVRLGLVAGASTVAMSIFSTESFVSARGFAGEDRAPGDYMSRALRKRVEALKTDIKATPSNDANIKARGAVVYDWMNAQAMSGIYLHPDLPSLMTTIAQPDYAQQGDRIKQYIAMALDESIKTLAAYDENPDIVGTVTAKTEGPWEVDTWVQFEQIYTVGDAAIEPGGGVVLPNHFYFSFAELQATDPKGDNYCSVRCSNPAVTFEAASFPIIGMFAATLAGGISARVFFKVKTGTLRKGETVTVTYGDRSGGSKGIHLIQLSNSALRFPLWISTKPGGPVVTPREAILPVFGGEAAAVHGFVPSIVGIGETVEVSVRTEDKFRNLAVGGAPEWKVLLNGKPYRKIPASPKAISIMRDVRFDQAGVYRFTFESADGKLHGEADPILVEAHPGDRIYWGETHAHCGFSEGMGLLDPFFEFARDEARLDFCCLSEHDLWLDASEWEAMRQATRKFDAPGKFVTFMGYEWSALSPYGGHHNVIFRDIDGVLPVVTQRFPTLPDLYGEIRKHYDPKSVLIIPHAHMTADATQNDAALEPLVEIVSEHGGFEFLGRRYLANGFQLGFVGGDDDHLGHPGYKMRPIGKFYFDGPGGLAGVYAQRKDRRSLFDAMKARHTYATSQARIILRTSFNGRPMGEIVPSSATRKIEGAVYGTAPIESITLVKNGVDYKVLAYDEATQDGQNAIIELRFWSDSDPIVRLTAARSERVWAGTASIEGCEIVAVSSPEVEALNYLSEWARPSAKSTNAVDFRLTTRGNPKSMRFHVRNITGTPTIRISAESETKTANPFEATIKVPAPGQAPVKIDAPYSTPGGLLRAGGKFTDSVSARWIQPATERDRTFSFVDADAVADGDNYYLRIVQADGNCAWSSPAWVGEVKRAATVK
ncbi:MAG: DUF3604 domain-containing protein [Novosphingobium sp.]|nr:DUF3604 domain-containing protein [Novosphingobium sp.]